MNWNAYIIRYSSNKYNFKPLTWVSLSLDDKLFKLGANKDKFGIFNGIYLVS